MALLTPGRGGQKMVVLTGPEGDSAEIYLFGAHVTSWKSAQGRERLFLSERAVFNGAKAIRGGIPIVFPQFGPRGPLPQHGFARTATWEVVQQSQTEVVLRLASSEQTMKVWPHTFVAEYTVGLKAGNQLLCRLQVTNKGAEPFSFTTALHTYFAVADIARTELHGLQGVRYEDQLKNDEESTEERAAVTFDRETDRVYKQVPATLSIRDGASVASVQIDTDGFRDAVVWNPWVEKTAKMADMAPDEYRRMVCVEAGCVDCEVIVQAQQTWTGEQVLTGL